MNKNESTNWLPANPNPTIKKDSIKKNRTNHYVNRQHLTPGRRIRWLRHKTRIIHGLGWLTWHRHTIFKISNSFTCKESMIITWNKPYARSGSSSSNAPTFVISNQEVGIKQWRKIIRYSKFFFILYYQKCFYFIWEYDYPPLDCQHKFNDLFSFFGMHYCFIVTNAFISV